MKSPLSKLLRLDRQLALALVLSLIVFATEGTLIIRAQSPCIDDNYHLYRGLLYLRGDFATLRDAGLNDPPLGEALSAIPAWLNHIHMPDPAASITQSLTTAPPPELCFSLPDSTRIQIAIWKAILLLPMIAIIFYWLTTLYGHRAAWLATAMLLIEPTLAAHAPLPTVDVLGLEGILIACFACWHFVQNPTISRGIATAVAIAFAMLLKHTAIILPAILLLYAIAQWIARERLYRWRQIILPRLLALVSVYVGVVLLMWALLGFDISRANLHTPAEENIPSAKFISAHRLPMGIYLGSVLQAVAHDRNGHKAFLLGQSRKTGWWYYFPVVATYKVPIGIAIVLALGLISLRWSRLRYAEIFLLIPALVWTIALVFAHIDIGFRHFLPPYIFCIMLASRCVVQVPRKFPITAIAWTATTLAAIHVALFLPNQISYINFPRRSAYLSISDSNLDWGQSIKQIRRWLNDHPNETRPIYVGYFGPLTVNLYKELGPRLTCYTNRVYWLPAPNGSTIKTPLPNHGILILSPVLLTGQYDPADRFEKLRSETPIEKIADCLLVYDLDSPNNREKIP